MNRKITGNRRLQRQWILAVTFCFVIAVCVIPLFPARAQNPSSGTVGPAPGGTSAAWDQTVITPGGGVNTEAACVDGVNCEVFTLSVAGTTSSWAGQKVRVQLNWQSSGNEYDIWVHKGASVSDPVLTSAMAGPGLTSQTAYIDPATDGTGTFTIHVVPDTTPVVTDHYHGTATAVALTPAPPPPAPEDPGAKIGYENFAAPGVLVPVTTTEAGQQVHSVEYMGRNAGEPSVGSNWATGVANYQSGLQTLFVTFDDSCSSTGQSAAWVNRAAPSSVAIDSDPIGFTDRGFTDLLGFHSRVFAAELTLLSPNTVKISHSDDDGVTWIGPDQPGGVTSAIDHETIGAGPYRNAPNELPPVVGTPLTTYPNAVYYCSQDLAAAFCARSDTGGSTYGPSVPLYNVTACGGLHGHVKVSPETTETLANGSAGIVYVPNRDCGGVQSLVVSKDNGLTWAIHPVQNGASVAVPGTIGTGDDPAVGVDNGGRVYFSFSNGGTAASVATSEDSGLTWNNIFDVGAVYGINNATFPAAVAGTDGRAAVAYYGSPSGTGDSNTDKFTGVWHLYIAHTFDGGMHWTTTDATPNAPMQRGGILRGGGADIVRNLLDFFDITIDRDGRVLVGYVNGCEGGNCAQAAPTATGNAYTVTATIARQSSGRRLVASKDPVNSTSRPGMPSVTQRRVGQVVHLGWSEADTGNSTITGYKILRGTASGDETLLTTVTGTQTGGSYDDITGTDTTKTYYYKVLALNAAGTSCGNNEIAAQYVGDTCDGIIIHRNDPTHPEASAGTATPASLLIDYVAVGEPPSSPGNFMFKMKVNSLAVVPPNSRWRITWNSASSPGQQYYVGMTTGPSGPPTFEYGTLADAGVPAVFVIQETKIAAALTGSNYNADGTITIFAPKSAFGNPQPGDLLGAVGGRTITADTSDCSTDLPPCTPNSQLERSNAFVDHTFVKAQADNSYPASTYTVAGNVSCAAPTPAPTPTPATIPCNGTVIEDDDPHISYSNGWHLISNPNAYGGHYRLNEGGNNARNVVLTFNTLPAQAGSITYFYATSQKGGSAQVVLDGSMQGTVNYNSSSGSNRSPIFGASMTFSYGPTSDGHHTLEIRPVSEAIYIDGFCIGNATITGSPATGPGITSESLVTQSAGQALLRTITLPTGTQAISIAADSSVAVPIQLVLINPSGSVVQTVNSSSGVAILEAPITQSGVYVIKTVNLNMGPVQIWSVSTPLVSNQALAQMLKGSTPEAFPPLLANILLEVGERVLAWCG
ncbi:MAG: sialidase family protein [Pyrinomonadaceae bacterium]